VTKRWIRCGDRQGIIQWDSSRDQIEFRFPAAGGDYEWTRASVVQAQPGVYSVVCGSRSYEVKIVPAASGWAVDVAGRHFVLEVGDPRESVRKPSAMGGNGPLRLVAPMPGKVVHILVNPGDRVEPGQGLVVVEAMKMQNEVKAPRSGNVTVLTVIEGATVAAGEVVAVLE
jgi:biotin carboxyl carrier protein